MGVFLRILARGKSIYTAALDNGVVSTDPAGGPGSLSQADEIQLFDPTAVSPPSIEPVLRLSIYGSLTIGHSWQNIKFYTRCFLAAGTTDQTANVELDLNQSRTGIQITSFTVFGVGPAPGSPNLPALLGGLTQFTFVYQPSNGFFMPVLVAALGLRTDSPGAQANPALMCTPGNNNVCTVFSIVLPLSSGTQQLTHYGINFDPHDYPSLITQPFNQATLTFAIREFLDNRRVGPFWILEIWLLPAGVVLDAWNNWIAQPYLDSLNTARSGLPASFVPTFETNADQQTSFIASFAIADRTAGKPQPKSQDYVLINPDLSLVAGKVNVVSRTLGLDPQQSLVCTAQFPNLERADAAPLQTACLLLPPYQSDGLRFCEPTAGFCFGFRHQFEQYPPQSTQPVVRMGALDLHFPDTSGNDTLTSDSGKIHASFRPGGSRIPGCPGLPRIDLLTIELGIAKLGAGGQDDVPGAEYAQPNQPFPRCGLVNAAAAGRAPAIQIPKEDLEAGGDYFILDITETCYEGVSQTLTLAIEQQQIVPGASRETGGSPAPNTGPEIIVIDTEPFLVALVKLPNYLTALETAVTDQIFSWDNSAADASWQISAGAQAFQLTLPPQGLTEAMHKQAGDITPGQPADYRFTPAATLNLLTSPQPTRFVEVPWNLRRVLGYPAQTAPGAVLQSATFELVYGISGSLTAKPGLLVAEIGARLGQLPAPPPLTIPWQYDQTQEKGYQAYTNFWADLFVQLRTRLGVLEPWSAPEPSWLTLTETDNLTFTLRTDADLGYPVSNSGPPAGNPDKIPNGALKGSFSWAFDSDRIYQALWSKTDSVTCELSGLEFSALGGWGDLTARYANGKTSIIASVRMGRIQKLTVEQIGRIGNFWNRAKLVITYERTVVPTTQFADVEGPPSGSPPQQRYAFLGNPILRKTAEYVQILEKKRDAAPSDTTGAYSACEFPQGDPPIIPVDSNWGENVGQTGYKIPLWRPGAQPADVYKKPLVRLHLKSSVSDDTSPAIVADPEKLCFYTDTDASLGTNTDSWPKQLGVDYGYITAEAVAPTNADSAAQQATNADGNVDNFQGQPDPWIEPILGPFTYSLEPAPLASNVTSGFSSTPIGATLRNITIMRGLDVSALLDSTKDSVRVNAQGIPGQVSNILRPVISQIPFNATANELVDKVRNWKTQAQSGIDAFTSALGSVTNVLPNPDALKKTLCGALKTQIGNQWTFLANQVENQLAGLLTGASDVLNTQPNAFSDVQNLWTGSLYPSIQQGLRFSVSEADSIAAKAKSAVDSQYAPVIAALNAIVRELSSSPPGAPAQVLSDVQNAFDAIDETLSTADAVIAGILNPVTGGKFDQIRQSIFALRGQIASAALKIEQEISTATHTAAADAQQLILAAKSSQTAIDGWIDGLNTAAQGLGATALESTLASVDSKIRAATDWDAFRTAAAADLTALSTNLQTTITGYINEIDNRVNATTGNYIDAACTLLTGDLTQAEGALRNLFNGDAIGRYFDILAEKMATGNSLLTGADVAATVEKYLHGLENPVNQFMGAVLPALSSIGSPPLIPSSAAPALFLLRGFGDVPKVPQLGFNADFTAYRFAQFAGDLGFPVQLPNVNLTPMVGLANTLADVGNAVGLKVPTFELGDSLIPFNLSQFNLGSFLPKIAGLDLSSLFSGLRLPQDPLPLGQYITVTHGEDPQSRSAWVDIALNFEIDNAQVFSYFGVTLVLVKAVLTANTKVNAEAGQPVSRAMSGSITGDWSMTVGGFDIVILEQCTLTFDQSGHFGFNVTPAKVKFQGVLNFLADVLSDFFSGDGFTTSITPAGMQTVLNLPLPDIQSGTFGIANLELNARFGLTFSPFMIQFGLGLASLEQPFTLTVFILGGAGYLSLDVSYTPENNIIAAEFDIGIFASASLAISLGPISGGIYAYFGITVSYRAATGSAPDLQIGLVLMFSGNVSLLGFLSVSLMLALFGTYDSGTHVLNATGTISYSIQIGPFFSINVNASVSYRFSNDAALSSPPDPGVYYQAAQEYLEMFYN